MTSLAGPPFAKRQCRIEFCVRSHDCRLFSQSRRGLGSPSAATLPQALCDRQRVDIERLPPNPFIASFMKLAMVDPAYRDGELVADFHAERPWLGKAQMMGIGRGSAADHAGLRRDKLPMLLVARRSSLANTLTVPEPAGTSNSARVG
jgi:hypothetical protein